MQGLTRLDEHNGLRAGSKARVNIGRQYRAGKVWRGWYVCTVDAGYRRDAYGDVVFNVTTRNGVQWDCCAAHCVRPA